MLRSNLLKCVQASLTPSWHHTGVQGHVTSMWPHSRGPRQDLPFVYDIMGPTTLAHKGCGSIVCTCAGMCVYMYRHASCLGGAILASGHFVDGVPRGEGLDQRFPPNAPPPCSLLATSSSCRAEPSTWASALPWIRPCEVKALLREQGSAQSFTSW